MFASLWTPDFSLRAALRLTPEALGSPVVLAGDYHKVAELNLAAQRAGVAGGMALPKALGRCAALRVLQPSAAAERQAARLLWATAWQLTPQIEPTAPGLLTLRLHPAQVEQAAQALMELLPELQAKGLPTRSGIAETPALALLAARAAEVARVKYIPEPERRQALLEALPLALGDLPPRWLPIFEGWGVRTLGEVAKLPRQALGERLGADGLRVWDELNGRFCRPLQIAEWQPDFTETYEPEEPLENLQALVFWLKRALESLAAQLQGAIRVARSVTLELRVVEADDYRRTIRLPEPTADAELLHRLLQHHLDSVHVGGPIARVWLRLDPIDPAARQAGLFDTQIRNPWRLAETLDELAGLVGPENLGRPVVGDTHRDDVFRLEALPEELTPVTDQFDAEPPDQETFSQQLKLGDTGTGEPLPHNASGLAELPAEPPAQFRRGGPAAAVTGIERAGPPMVVAGPTLRRFRPPLEARVRLSRPVTEQPLLPGLASSARNFTEAAPPVPEQVESLAATGRVIAARGPFETSGDWWTGDPWHATEWDVELPAQGCFRLRQETGNWCLLGAWD
ncbi:MAG: hypothetical protein ACFB21_06225 [Opitutales bacterium]